METMNEHQVRERAYYIWEGEGRIHGRADAHWLRAEAELRVTAEAPKAVGKSRAKVAEQTTAAPVAEIATKPAARKPAARKAVEAAPAEVSAKVAKTATKPATKPAAKTGAKAPAVPAALAAKAKAARAAIALH